MESELLMREDEFYKENEKLEQRTKELMKKVNDVMKIQDNLIKQTLKTKTEITNAKITCKASAEVDEAPKCLESAGDSGNNDELGLPKSVSGMGKKGATYFYRAKIKALQTENIKLHNENIAKTDEVKRLQKQNINLSEEKEKWFNAYNSAKNTIGKLESQLSSLSSKIQSKDSEVISIKKEAEHLKKELKSTSTNLNGSEVRLNRAYEENEKLKESIKQIKEEEKEIKVIYKKQINDLTCTVKQIEKHKLELINGFKKQLQLIDVLKKQKMYLEAYKISEMCETEYNKILNWKTE